MYINNYIIINDVSVWFFFVQMNTLHSLVRTYTCIYSKELIPPLMQMLINIYTRIYEYVCVCRRKIFMIMQNLFNKYLKGHFGQPL